MNYDACRGRYFHEILAPLDPQKVWGDLHALADEHEPVIILKLSALCLLFLKELSCPKRAK